MDARFIELLAPAGNEVCLHAAVRAGADAVYLGAGEFNARRGADNFTLESLEEACAWAHVRGVRIYLTVNTVVLPSEVDAALELVRQAWRSGVDAFIVQDIGLAAEITRTLPEAQIHISTQMNTHNSAGIEAAAALGATRVTLAREMALPEIAHLCDFAHERAMQVEVFAHGALCICYSGQCFASSLVGGRSANRGMCAQVCRLPYELHNASVRKPLDAPGEHLLSPKDLCSIDVLEQLVGAGVDSLKIEGRMKSPEYVYSVVSTYRAVLDRITHRGAACDSAVDGGGDDIPSEGPSAARACALVRSGSSLHLEEIASQSSREGVSKPSDGTPTPPPLQVALDAADPFDAGEGLAEPAGGSFVTEGERRALSEAFSRGFTTAYITSETGNDMMSYGRPNNRGVRVGRVAGLRDGLVELECEVPLVVGDVVEFWTNKGHFAHTIDSLEERGGSRVAFAVAKAVGKGDRVFRVRSAEAAFIDDPHQPRIPVVGAIELRIGQPLRFGLGSQGAPERSVQVSGSVVEAARTKAISTDEVRDHIDRFGNTPFALRELDVQLDNGVGLGFSTLHHVRAEAADLLQERLLEAWSGRVLPKKPDAKKRAATSLRAPSTTVEVCAWATNAACARAARKAGADAIYVPALNYKRGEATVAGQRSATVEQAGYPKQAVVALPTIDHDRVDGSREAAHGFDPWKYTAPGRMVFADSWSAVYRALGQGMEVEVGPHVPVTNALSANLLASMGVVRIWLSPELTLGQIQRIAEQSTVPLGLFVSGAAELMITEHCLLQSQGACNQNCDACPRRTSPHYLKDRKGYEMPVITDCTGRSHLFNAVPLDLLHLAPDLIGAGISAFMVDTTLLNTAQSTSATARAVRARDLALRTGDAIGKTEGTTTGHVFRGVS